RRHTRSKRDWSSDVCSSDLTTKNPPTAAWCRFPARQVRHSLGIVSSPNPEWQQAATRPCLSADSVQPQATAREDLLQAQEPGRKIGRASCRERGESQVGEGA